MCGIAGILTLNGPAPERSSVAAMTDAMAHRGPDGARVVDLGPLVLGHRRLSILDPTAASDQPMQTPDGRYHLVHNGEIYNFLELAEELSSGWSFRTRSDTEVILAAHARWGEAAVERFNGIWAFALWDAVEHRLLISRDRLGVKPMFLARHGAQLAFASEIKALLALPQGDRTPDAGIVRDYLTTAIVDHSERTFFEGIRRLPAGHNLVIDLNGERRRRYWSAPARSSDASPRGQPGDGERIAEIRKLLIDSVALELRSDVPIGSCLSGGLDSSSIVGIAEELRRGTVPGGAHRERDQHPQFAFFAAFTDPAIDERRYVADVVDRTGVTLRTTSPDSAAFVRSLPDIVRAQDEPFVSSSIVAQYHVMQIAREAGVKVLLDGQGADELFGGYPVYVPQRLAGRLRTGDIGALRGTTAAARLPVILAAAAFNGRRRPSWVRTGRFMPSLLGEVTSRARGEAVEVPRGGTLLARVLARDLLTSHLPALLRYEDRNSMAFGIEARVPFLDHRLIEAAHALPDRLRIEGADRKVALRRAVGDFVPASIIERRDKIGFETPESRWLHERARDLRVWMSNHASEEIGLLAGGAIDRTLRAWETGRIAHGPLWRVLNLELWAQGLRSAAQ